MRERKPFYRKKWFPFPHIEADSSQSIGKMFDKIKLFLEKSLS